ncbi:MAG: hypothetical protein ACRC2K_01235 [Clostridium sp.]
MKENFNSLSFWEEKVNENKTIRGHMFMDTVPTKKTVYIHTLIYSQKNGIENVYGYFPDAKALLGYIQYSFLQEAFYKWIYGTEERITVIPQIPVTKLAKTAFEKGKLSRPDMDTMIREYNALSKLWSCGDDKIMRELDKFARMFNKLWIGDNREFLYIKIFRTPRALGEFVVNSNSLTNSHENLEQTLSLDVDSWLSLCSKVVDDELLGDEFRQILLKNLTEII